MSIIPVRNQKGYPRAECMCDFCDRIEVMGAKYKRTRGQGDQVDEGPLIRRLQQMGWSKIKGKIRCPICEAKRKSEAHEQVKSMNESRVISMQSVKSKSEAVREPTKKQRVQIFAMLAEVYDIDAGRYMQGDTDDTVAEVLGVMPGWVSEIRAAEFGPDGNNEDIDALADEIAAFRTEAVAAIKAGTEHNEKMIKALDRAADFGERLNRIRAAIGPRNQKKAGV